MKYNIFVFMNISTEVLPEETLAQVFHMLGQPVRIQILLTIGEKEACVCHLEARLGLRQAAISQHLMALRDANLVYAQREGRNIYYHLVKPGLLDVVRQVGRLTGIPDEQLNAYAQRPVANCPCPKCNPEMDVSQICDEVINV